MDIWLEIAPPGYPQFLIFNKQAIPNFKGTTPVAHCVISFLSAGCETGAYRIRHSRTKYVLGVI